MTTYNHIDEYRKNNISFLNIKNFTDEIIWKILSETRKVTLEFTEMRPVETWVLLNKEVLKKENVGLRLYSYDGTWKDLSFLKYLYNLKSLHIQDPYVEDLTPILEINDLVDFSIGKTSTKKLSIKPVEKFKNLASILIEGKKTDINVLSNIKSLKKLSFFSTGIRHLNIIEDCILLEKLIISESGITDLDTIIEMKQLKYVFLEGMKKLEDIDFVTNLANLNYLHLKKVALVKHLPDLEKCISLKKIVFEYVKGIENLDIVRSAKVLEEFSWYSPNECQKTDFMFIYNINTIKHIYINCLPQIDYNHFVTTAAEKNIAFNPAPSGKFEYLTF